MGGVAGCSCIGANKEGIVSTKYLVLLHVPVVYDLAVEVKILTTVLHVIRIGTLCRMH